VQPVMVDEPSVPDTVSILRGIKERYQTHHGVVIQDAALVLAAKLAKRYITTRRLPDSAIDLLDEAAAGVRVALDSAPEIIDQLQRRQLQLEVEATALEAEKDPASKARLGKVQEELSSLEEKLAPLQLKHAAEKHRVEELRNLQKKLDSLKNKLVRGRRSGPGLLLPCRSVAVFAGVSVLCADEKWPRVLVRVLLAAFSLDAVWSPTPCCPCHCRRSPSATATARSSLTSSTAPFQTWRRRSSACSQRRRRLQLRARRRVQARLQRLARVSPRRRRC